MYMIPSVANASPTNVDFKLYYFSIYGPKIGSRLYYDNVESKHINIVNMI